MNAFLTTFRRHSSGFTFPAAADEVKQNGQFYGVVMTIAGGAIALNQWSVCWQ